MSSARLGHSETHSLPLLDIEELLALRPWESRPLDGAERELLRRARDFLRSAQEGRRILERAAAGEFVPDLGALEAYEYLRRAVNTTMPDPACSAAEREKILAGVLEEIASVLEEDQLRTSRPSESARLANEFFEMLVDYSRE
jgi:hypothetical protein